MPIRNANLAAARKWNNEITKNTAFEADYINRIRRKKKRIRGREGPPWQEHQTARRAR